MKKVFLTISISLVLVTAKFVHTQITVQQQFGPSSMLAVTLLLIAAAALLLSYLLIDTRHREKVIGFWLVSTSTAIAYILIDLLAGYVLITPLSPELVPDEVRHHKLVPNAYAKFEQKDFSYVQRNNRHGLRGTETTIEKPSDTYRILTLGDSFTMGKGVEDGQSFSALLDEQLNAQLSACRSPYSRVEVLNAGVDSYAPILSYLYLITELQEFDPDLVILNLDNSDLIQEAAYRSIAVRDAAGGISGVPGQDSKVPFSERIRNWIESNLYVTRLILFYTNKAMGHKDLTVRGVVTRANAEIIAHTLESDQVDRSAQWQDIFESLKLIQAFTKERSIRFIVSLYPWAHQVSEEEWVPGRYTYLTEEDRPRENYDRMIMALAEKAGIETISLYQSFREYAGSERLYFEHDPHFTIYGHRLMAAQLLNQLIDAGFNGEWCGTN